MKPTQKPKAPTRRDRTFHHQRPEFAEHSFARHLIAGTITEDDISLIREWIDEISANRHLSISRANKIAFNMVALRRFIGPLRTNTIKDIQQGVRTLMTATGGRRLFDKDMPAVSGQDSRDGAPEQPGGRPYKRNTLYDLIGLLKRFYLWMAENQYSDIEPRKIRAIKTPSKDKMTKTVDSIVTPEEAEAIIRTCESPRDRVVMASRARAKLIVFVSEEVVQHLSDDFETLKQSRLLKTYVESFCNRSRPMTLGFIDENGEGQRKNGEFRYRRGEEE